MGTRVPWRRWLRRIQHLMRTVAGLHARRRATLNAVSEPTEPWPQSPVSSEAGAAAVELAFVLPAAMLLLMGIMQFGAMLFLQNTMVNVANDIGRRIAVGDLSNSAGEALAESRLSTWNATFTVNVTEPTADDIQVDISVPLSEAAIVDFGHWFDAGDLTARATLRKE